MMNNTKQEISILRGKGLTFRKIGEMMGISRQRVHQLYSGYKYSPPRTIKKKFITPDIVRYNIIVRDKFRCYICKYKGTWRDRKLIVHHKDKSGSSENQNNSPENLVTLCNSCHVKAHYNEAKYPELFNLFPRDFQSA